MKTVLVIDSDADVLMLLEMLLRRMKKSVLPARTGIKGLEIARTQRPDVIMLDDRLPNMTGKEVCQRLRNNPQTRSIPIILTSTALLQNAQAYAHNIGADSFLAKPFQARQVAAVLNGLR